VSDDPARLADRDAVRELRARYSLTYDAGQLDAFCDLFTEDAVLQLGILGPVSGREAIRAALAGLMPAADFVAHFTSDDVTEFTGDDTARGTSRFAVHYGRNPNMQGAGTYHDEYRRTAAGWRFTSRTIEFFYMGPRGEWPPAPARQ